MKLMDTRISTPTQLLLCVAMSKNSTFTVVLFMSLVLSACSSRRCDPRTRLTRLCLARRAAARAVASHFGGSVLCGPSFTSHGSLCREPS